MKDLSEGDRVEFVNAWREPSLESTVGQKGVVQTIGHGEANRGYYKVQFHALGGFDSPYKCEWVLGNRLKKL